MTPFDWWCMTVSAYLELYAGRTLADLPISRYPLRTWYRHGIAAQALALLLVPLCPHRATLVRYYTDRRPRDTLIMLAHRIRSKEVSHV